MDWFAPKSGWRRNIVGCGAVAVSGEKERLHAAMLVSPAAERRKACKARHQAAARLQAEQAKVEREAAKVLAEREERKATTFLPAAGEAGPAALRSPGRLRVPQHQDTSATLAEAYPFMAEGDLGSDGVFIGQDLYSGDSFVYDPWVLHTHFGQENFQREQDGSFAKLESSFGNLVLYRATAKRAFERFTKGDQFVAEYYAHDYTYERDGQNIAGEKFFAKKIGHDTARTRYDADRTPRHAMNRDTAGQAFEPPQQSAPAPTGLSI